MSLSQRECRVTPFRTSPVPLPLVERPAWFDDARCRGVDPELFFPTKTGPDSGWEAKKVCAGCPVRELCLEMALERGEKYGVWGGLSERQRRRIRRSRGLQRPGERSDVLEPKFLVHGTESSYSRGGCRCQVCRDGHALYVRERKADRAQISGNPQG